MSFKEQGVGKYARLIQQNIDQARYLGALIEERPNLKLAAPIALNVVCFRYVSADRDDDELDIVNREIVIELQEQGIAMPSGTTLNGRYVIHTAVTNHRSRREDFDAFVDAVAEIGDRLCQQQ